jgi:para-nitrobenzyl esterase
MQRVALALAAGALACALLAPQAELAGSAWQLVEIQSMDDSVTRPDDGSKYTLAFDADGRVSLRADCNRGSGTWTSAQPSQLQFGPIAATRAMCPPGSLDARFLRDLGYVRSYVLREGRLYLALMADGGIYVFEKQGDPS